MGGPAEDDTDTEPEAPGGAASAEVEGPGLIVAFSSDGWEHVGAWLPIPRSELGKPRILGRGLPQADDEHQRLRPLRQRPGVSEPLAPFDNPALSRVQLLVRRSGPASLHVTSVGRCRFSVNGVDVKEAGLVSGDVLALGSQLVLLCAVRPAKFPGAKPKASHVFGRPDAWGFVGESPAAWRLRAQVASAAPRAGHAIVFGATGTGKELVAGALHRLSGRTGTLLSRNAATLPETLVDAELFGNLKDYPNPGMPDRKGLVGAADGGTLFLDEFAELPQHAQAHMLRALDRGEYQRLGETTLRSSRFRLVAATNRPTSALREDLLARFDFRFTLPNLAERREDVPLVARHLFAIMAEEAPDLCARYSTDDGAPRFDADFVSGLLRHSFPLNVRELRSVLWSSLHESGKSSLEWPASVVRAPATRADGSGSIHPEASEVERVLAEHGGAIEKSWRALGLSSRHALTRLLKKHGIVVRKEPRRG